MKPSDKPTIKNQPRLMLLLTISAMVLWMVLMPSFARADEPLTPRQNLERFSPIYYEVLLRLEAKRGKKYEDRELEGVLFDKDFESYLPKVKAEFCAKPANANILACMK